MGGLDILLHGCFARMYFGEGGYLLHSGYRFAAPLWGGPPGPRRTPPSVCRQAGQGADRGRGRPPHIAPQMAVTGVK
jgi:hypothetical protein